MPLSDAIISRIELARISGAAKERCRWVTAIVDLIGALGTSPGATEGLYNLMKKMTLEERAHDIPDREGDCRSAD